MVDQLHFSMITKVRTNTGMPAFKLLGNERNGQVKNQSWAGFDL